MLNEYFCIKYIEESIACTYYIYAYIIYICIYIHTADLYCKVFYSRTHRLI